MKKLFHSPFFVLAIFMFIAFSLLGTINSLRTNSQTSYLGNALSEHSPPPLNLVDGVPFNSNLAFGSCQLFKQAYQYIPSGYVDNILCNAQPACHIANINDNLNMYNGSRTFDSSIASFHNIMEKQLRSIIARCSKDSVIKIPNLASIGPDGSLFDNDIAETLLL